MFDILKTTSANILNITHVSKVDSLMFRGETLAP